MIIIHRNVDYFKVDLGRTKDIIKSTEEYLTKLKIDNDNINNKNNDINGFPFFEVRNIPFIANADTTNKEKEKNIVAFNEFIGSDEIPINDATNTDTNIQNIIKSIKFPIVLDAHLPKLDNLFDIKPINDEQNTFMKGKVEQNELKYILNVVIDFLNKKLNKKNNFQLLEQSNANLLLKADASSFTKQYDIETFIYNKETNIVKQIKLEILTEQYKNLNGRITITNLEVVENKYVSQNKFDKNLPALNQTVLPYDYKHGEILVNIKNPNERVLISQEDIDLETERQKYLSSLKKEYKCYGSVNINAKTQEECEKFNGVWDKEVETDTECPFYLANKNWDNNRGGVNNGGYCEMPNGVQIRGFKFYDQTPNAFKPLCYNCKTPLNNDSTLGTCCEEQKDKLKYPFLSSPDYKFPGDNLDRYNQRNTFLSKNLSYK